MFHGLLSRLFHKKSFENRKETAVVRAISTNFTLQIRLWVGLYDILNWLIINIWGKMRNVLAFQCSTWNQAFAHIPSRLEGLEAINPVFCKSWNDPTKHQKFASITLHLQKFSKVWRKPFWVMLLGLQTFEGKKIHTCLTYIHSSKGAQYFQLSWT